MHGLRRRLSEPRMAGHRPADRSANQRVTSAGDSFLCILMCVIKHTYSQSKKAGRKSRLWKTRKRPDLLGYLGICDRNYTIASNLNKPQSGLPSEFPRSTLREKR